MEIGFVFTNYNNTHYSEQLLESLSELECIDECHVIFVDNASSLASREQLVSVCSKYPYAVVIINEENLGYFRGLNCGIEYLNTHFPKCELIIVGNNDLIFPNDFDAQLDKNKLLFAKYPVISPNIVTINGDHQNPHVIRKTHWFRELMYDVYFLNFYISRFILFTNNCFKFLKRRDHEMHQSSMEIYQGYGACYILGPLFIQKFKRLWAPTFLMGEEFFLSHQLSQEGCSMYYEHSISLIHAEHATTKKVPRREMWKISREAHKIYRKFNPLF